MKTYKYVTLFTVAVILGILAVACGQAAPEVQTVVETVVVKETVEVEVEKEVIKEVEVEKEVVVTKEVEVEVEKIVEVPAEEVELVYMTAGDVNMLALAQNLLAAKFKEDVNPNVNLRKQEMLMWRWFIRYS